MTIAITVSPPFPFLYAALWLASLAVSVRATCLLAVFLLARREDLPARLLGWQAAALGLCSVTLFSAEAWQYGVPLAVTGAWCGVLRRRERMATAKECA